MADDLGTWPPEQARVLLDALQQAGLSPKARRTREGISVSVEDDESDQAHRTLVANMDAIAQAARSKAQPRPRQPRARPQREGRNSSDRPLASQRLSNMSRPLLVLVVGAILALVMPAPLRIPLVVFTIAALVYVLGKQAQDGEGGSGPDRRGR